MSVAKLDTIALDCPDPVALAEFYAAVIGGTVNAEQKEWVVLTGHGGSTLAFQPAPGYVPPKWPSPEQSQQFHLDLAVDDLDTAEAQILALGAKVLDAEDRSRSWRVYADPAGHPFCLCAC
ncbi:VOC family protein [Streptomyces sp. T-3]|nr:VOC family protein [Streptomyces sp. T-3]